jgi:hypothetical protein
MIDIYIINSGKNNFEHMKKVYSNPNLNIIQSNVDKLANFKPTFLCRNFLCSKKIIDHSLSHINLWLSLQKSSENIFIILEDSIESINTEYLILIYEYLQNNIFDWDLINLTSPTFDLINNNNLNLLNQTKNINKELKLIKTYESSSTKGYIISKNGLNKLIKIFNINQINWNIDWMINLYRYIENINYYCVNQNIINIQSTIDESYHNNITFFILKKLKQNKIINFLNKDFIGLRLDLVITYYILLWISLFIINYKYFQNKILFGYLIGDIILYYIF